MSSQKTRVALLGAQETEVELLAELHRAQRVQILGVYDPDPSAVGLGIAEVLGVPAGYDDATRQRLRDAEVIVLPADRFAVREAIDWCAGLRAELVSLDQARRRWGSTRGEGVSLPSAEALLEGLEAAGDRLAAPAELGAWLVDIGMQAVGATGGSLQLYSTTTEALYVLAARGLSEHTMRNAQRRLGEPVAGIVAESRRSQQVHGRHAGSRNLDRGRVESAISVPLVGAAGGVLGVLNVSTTIPGHAFQSQDTAALETLAPRLAVLLERSLAADAGVGARRGEALAQLLSRLEAHGATLQPAFAQLCQQVRDEAEADNVALYLAGDSGEWLLLANADRLGTQPLPASRSAADRAFLENKAVQLLGTGKPALTTHQARADAEAEEALQSCVYAPLVATRPLGVLALYFRDVALAERFLRRGRTVLQTLALCLESRLHKHRDTRRIAALARLARGLPTLFVEEPSHTLEDAVLRLVAEVASARQVIFRRVDEARHTYTPPATYGIPEEDVARWREFDSRVSENTLRQRTLQLTAARCAEDDRLDRPAHVASFISVPIEGKAGLTGILTAYNKNPRDFLDEPIFNDTDRELLEHLAVAVATALDVQPDKGKRAQPARILPPP